MKVLGNESGKEGKEIYKDNLLLILIELAPNKPYEFPWQQSVEVGGGV